MRMKSLKDESGQVLVMTVLCMTVLMGFMALAIDVGLLFRAKRNLQIAADATATATALDYYYDHSVANAEAVGTQAATDNGITASTGGPTVTINAGANGEITTSYHNSAGYFEAILTQPNPTFFMNVFGMSNVTVTARAVAGTPGAAQGCVYVMDPNAAPAMELQGSFTVTAAKCGIIVDSGANGALNFTGGGGSLTAGSVSVHGTATGHTGDSTPAPVTGVAPVTDPLQSIVPPTPSGCVAGGTLTGNIGTAGGTVCYTGNVKLSNAVVSGTIIVTGNLTLDSSVTSGAGGVTLDLTTGSLTENTNTTLGLVAPTTGTYNGIVLMAPLTNASTLEFDFGHSNGTLKGIIHAPGAELYLHDSGGDKGGGLQLTTDLIIGTLNDKTATLSINSYSASNPNSPLKAVSLVE